MDSTKKLRIGLTGIGNVGGSLWRYLQTKAHFLQERTSTEMVVTRVATRNQARAKELGVPESILTTQWQDVVQDPNVDVVLESMGGTTEALELVRSALMNNKHVITSNKALLAIHGQELFAIAAQQNRHLLFEASVGGGIPIIRGLRQGLIANHILSIHAIMNNSCNYILTRMTQSGVDFNAALEEAKKAGYTEKDESMDIDGHDSVHKAIVLTALIHGVWVKPEQVHVEGIRHIQIEDINLANKFGYQIKLLATIKRVDQDSIQVHVQPTLVPNKHVLASVNGIANAIAIKADLLEESLFYGRLKDSEAFASAFFSDLVYIANSTSQKLEPLIESQSPKKLTLKPFDDVVSRYYLRLTVANQTGILAQIAHVLGEYEIGISSVLLYPEPEKTIVPLTLLLYSSTEKNFKAALKEIEQLEVVHPPSVCLRVEDFE